MVKLSDLVKTPDSLDPKTCGLVPETVVVSIGILSKRHNRSISEAGIYSLIKKIIKKGVKLPYAEWNESKVDGKTIHHTLSKDLKELKIIDIKEASKEYIRTDDLTEVVLGNI